MWDVLGRDVLPSMTTPPSSHPGPFQFLPLSPLLPLIGSTLGKWVVWVARRRRRVAEASVTGCLRAEPQGCGWE